MQTDNNELIDIWNKTLKEIPGQVSAVSFDVWIKTLVPIDSKGDCLILSSPSASSKSLVEKNYKTMLERELNNVHKSFNSIEIVIEDEEIEKKQQSIIEPIKQKTVNGFNFNPKYTFDTFVVGGCNNFAVAAAKAVADNPGKKYNPLFIYGGVGLGKTHLLHAIGNNVQENHPELKVIYATTEQFMNELIQSISPGNKNENGFREKYRTADVLIIDDIQFIINKTSVQEEFFHTFNELNQNGKQIIITSDKPPKEINPLEERLRSRFEWGLLCDIGIPDFETKYAILKKKAQIERYNVENVVFEKIAQTKSTNIREIEGLLSRCVFYAGLMGKDSVNEDIYNEAMRTITSADDNETMTDLQNIVNKTAKYFNINSSDITGKRRDKKIVEARHVCIYIMTTVLKNYPLSSIGEFFGKDHATIIYARDKVKEELSKNKFLKIKIDDIVAMIKNV